MDAETDAQLPLVRVVVLNFDGGAMTLECLDSLLATDWPSDRLEIVMVDNGSLDDVVELVRTTRRYAPVRVIEPLANLGFAGGCNLGMRAPGPYDLVALVNNDATVRPDWLRAMVPALDRHPRTGAVAAKMLFASEFHGVELDVADAGHLRAGDPRVLGVRVTAVRLDGERIDHRLRFDERCYPPEPPARRLGEEIATWTAGRGALRIVATPSEPGESSTRLVSMRVSSLAPRTLRLRAEPHGEWGPEIEVGTEPTWVDVEVPGRPFDVVNNVGSELYAGGLAGDRGFQQIDLGQFDEPAEVFAWCGGATLLRREYLDEVGRFDERFFVYYEDTDLSWRGRLRGWRYEYEPGAVVRHHHAQSSGVGSAVFRFHTERNRLLMLMKNAPASLAWRAVLGDLRRTVTVTVSNYLVRPLTLRLPVRAAVTHRWKVTWSAAKLAPAMLRDRWARGRTVDRHAVMTWQRTKGATAS